MLKIVSIKKIQNIIRYSFSIKTRTNPKLTIMVLTYILLAQLVVIIATVNAAVSRGTRPNILLILADDLGYGDLSVNPFVGTGIQTPNLEKMAKNGLIMTNFHSAAPICSPSRASILTGLFPWRVGIAGVYEYGARSGGSNRNDWLNQMPTSAMSFLEVGYYTAHVGKWHLGGMRGTDLAERKTGKCSHPGPNQMGFQEYISMTEGPRDPRQQYLQHSARLHSEGGKYLIRNDEKYPCTDQDTLSNCEAKETIRIMKEAKSKGQPFFIHTWFETPHGNMLRCIYKVYIVFQISIYFILLYLVGPWEILPRFDKYRGSSRHEDRTECYKTMVSFYLLRRHYFYNYYIIPPLVYETIGLL